MTWNGRLKERIRGQGTMKTINTQYRLALDFFFRELSIYFFLSTASFVLFTIFTTYLFQQNPELTQKLLSSVISKFQGIIDNGNISLVQLFLNNVEASVLGILVGLIPFFFLPVLGIISNSAVLGLLFSSSQVAAFPLWKIILFGIMPHGIFELSAVLLSYAMGICICWNLTKKIVGHRKREHMKELLQNCFRVTVLIVIPLLIIAALVETYITGQLINTFM
jgi:stage II sporulation protein M